MNNQWHVDTKVLYYCRFKIVLIVLKVWYHSILSNIPFFNAFFKFYLFISVVIVTTINCSLIKRYKLTVGSLQVTMCFKISLVIFLKRVSFLWVHDLYNLQSISYSLSRHFDCVCTRMAADDTCGARIVHSISIRFKFMWFPRFRLCVFSKVRV